MSKNKGSDHKPPLVIIDGKKLQRTWRLVDMHVLLFGHLPEPGDPELTELEYARKLKEYFKGKMPTLKEGELYYEASRIIEEHEKSSS